MSDSVDNSTSKDTVQIIDDVPINDPRFQPVVQVERMPSEVTASLLKIHVEPETSEKKTPRRVGIKIIRKESIPDKTNAQEIVRHQPNSSKSIEEEKKITFINEKRELFEKVFYGNEINDQNITEEDNSQENSSQPVIAAVTDNSKSDEGLKTRNDIFHKVQEGAGPSKSVGDNEIFYLDLSDKLTKIIKISKDENGKFVAKMVPKNEDQPSSGISLIEHKNLANEILNCLKSINVSQDDFELLVDDAPTTSTQPLRSSMPSCDSSSFDVNGAYEIILEKFQQHLTALGSSLEDVLKEHQVPAPEEEPVIPQAPSPKVPHRVVDSPVLEYVPRWNFLEYAPEYSPTLEQFQNPIDYIKSIYDDAFPYGMCKILAPTQFRPSCNIPEDIPFRVKNQYVERLFKRWGPVTSNMSLFKASLKKDAKKFQIPAIDGVEVDLYTLYRQVQGLGGIEAVINTDRWSIIAEQMGFTKSSATNKKLEQYYSKFILPYDTLSYEEKTELRNKLETAWEGKRRKLVRSAARPLHNRRKMLNETDSSDNDEEQDGTQGDNVAAALNQVEECIFPGQLMQYSTFVKIGKKTMDTIFTEDEVLSFLHMENKYWEIVSKADKQLHVKTASIETIDHDYGFSTDPYDKDSKHDWNLKMIGPHIENALRCLGPIAGLTVPTLHLGMVFSTDCWFQDPHGLFRMDYLHEGAPKIWYGISQIHNMDFNSAVSNLVPASVLNKSLWLKPDTLMVPLQQITNNFNVTRTIQQPGEYIVIFPKAFASSVSIGNNISESVYFADKDWWITAISSLNEMKMCSEPSMLSIDHMLIAMIQDESSTAADLRRIRSTLESVVCYELSYRNSLKRLVRDLRVAISRTKIENCLLLGRWHIPDREECVICRVTLIFSKVIGVTGYTILCPEHAVQLLYAMKEITDQVTLVTNLTDDNLKHLLKAIDARIEED